MMSPENLHKITSGEIGLTIATVGLLGNIFSIIIWSRISNRPRNGKGDQTPACAAYFLAMAVIDSGLLVSFIAGDSLPVFLPVLKKSFTYAWLYSFLIHPLFYFFIFSSIWIVAAVTINRFLFVIHGKIFSIRKNILTIIIINIVGFLVQIPQFFHFRPFFTFEDNSTDGYWTYHSTNFAKSKPFIDYLFWLHCIFIVLVPWFIIAILNILLLHAVIKRTNSVFDILSYKDKVNRERKNRQMTITLLTVTITFLVLLAWQCVAQCFWQLGYHQDDPDQTIWNMVDMSFAFAKLGIIIHSSINCLLYYVSGPTFRREVSKFLGLSKKKKISSEQSSQTASTGISITLTEDTEK